MILLGAVVTVHVPGKRETAIGRVYYETATYVSVETPSGRCIGGPKTELRPAMRGESDG
jgi:hypothetical protein